MLKKVIITTAIITLGLILSVITTPLSGSEKILITNENLLYSNNFQDENDTANSTEQLAFGNNILYLHSNDNSDLWMNADKADPASTSDSYFQRYVGSGSVTEEFPEKPALDHTLYLDTNSSVVMDIHIVMEEGLYTDNCKLTLLAGQKTLGEGEDTVGDDNVHVEFIPSESEINASDNLKLIIELSFTAEFAYRIYTDGSSTIEMPIQDLNLIDSDEDGFSNQEEIDWGSDPYDPESFPIVESQNNNDEDEDNNKIIMLVAVCAIIAVVVAVAYKKKYAY